MNSLLTSLIIPEKDLPQRIAIIVAHPDDEVIAAGGQLHRWPNLFFIHATNGSPAALDDAIAAGCRTREEYAHLRGAEFKRVLRYLNLPTDRAISLNFGDQQSAFHLNELTDKIARTLHNLSPDLVLTHPFDGGHP